MSQRLRKAFLRPVYRFLMQIGMVLGFLTSYPVNVWLLTAGIKEAM